MTEKDVGILAYLKETFLYSYDKETLKTMAQKEDMRGEYDEIRVAEISALATGTLRAVEYEETIRSQAALIDKLGVALQCVMFTIHIDNPQAIGEKALAAYEAFKKENSE